MCLDTSLNVIMHDITFVLSLTSVLDNRREEPSLLLVLKWGGELTPAGRVQAEELGRAFRCMYPGGQGKCYVSLDRICTLYFTL
jgi:hypothetical protein